jgi:HK97 family phage prohead protease
MPMPTPNEGEDMAAFIARFMGSPEMTAEYPDGDQRLAVAYVAYGKEHLSYKNALFNPDVVRIKQSLCKVDAEDDGKEQANSRRLRGYASVSEIQDLERDRIMPGAWQKTLSERVKSGKVPLMTKHVVSGGVAADTIGWMTEESREDGIGLWADFVMLRSDLAAKAIDMCKTSLDLQKPVGLSVEFYPEKYDPNEFGGYDIHEAKLIQVTLTTTPCNELSGVYAVKTVPANVPAKTRKYRHDLRLALARAVLRHPFHTR